jgi:ribosomal protein S18 acetylase RimI-like enzyme
VTPEGLLGDYPAHVHINLLPRLQGQGWGRRLVEAIVLHLRAGDVPGVHLGVGANNERAIGFYTRLGFTDALRTEHVRFMVLSLDR